MSIKDLLTEAGFLAAKAGSKIMEANGLSDETFATMCRLDEIALELFEISKKIAP